MNNDTHSRLLTGLQSKLAALKNNQSATKAAVATLAFQAIDFAMGLQASRRRLIDKSQRLTDRIFDQAIRTNGDALAIYQDLQSEISAIRMGEIIDDLHSSCDAPKFTTLVGAKLHTKAKQPMPLLARAVLASLEAANSHVMANADVSVYYDEDFGCVAWTGPVDSLSLLRTELAGGPLKGVAKITNLRAEQQDMTIFDLSHLAPPAPVTTATTHVEPLGGNDSQQS